MSDQANTAAYKLVPVLLCGGSGTRLWPISRELHPKPFMRLPDGKTLLQKTYLRAALLPGVKDIVTVTNRDLLWNAKDDIEACENAQITNHYILEPFARNTAPAIVIAALEIGRLLGDDTIMLVLPADHVIENQQRFAEAVTQATALASQGKIVTFGIKPTAPETGYGYIQADGERVIRFVEKPQLADAKRFIESQDYLWNGGIFCFRVSSLTKECAQHAPHLLASAVETLAISTRSTGRSLTQLELQAQSFMAMPNISFDYALMEKSTNLGVVHCADMGWSDIGSWNAVADMTTPDEDGNRIVGNAFANDTSGCYIQSEYATVGTIGVKDLLIVHTRDALLVADKARAQDVKNLVDTLKKADQPSYKYYPDVHRPWGIYSVVETGHHYKVKRIMVKPGAALSLQTHKHRSEHWVVVSGQAKVRAGDRELILHPNESCFIEAGQLHRLENVQAEPLIIIELQIGSYLGEDDIVRFDDRYDRPEAKIVDLKTV